MIINPLFSIITVTRNNLKGLKKTTGSLVEQTHHNYEWIIIDGGSNDGSVEYLENLKTNYISEPDDGIYDAMNKGLSRVRGKYIVFLNAGDKLKSKHTLLEIEERVKDQNFDFIYGDSVEEKDQKIFYKRSRPHTKITQGMFTHHQAMIYRQDIVKNLKYETEYKIAADYDFTLKVIKKSKAFLYLPFPICIFESGGISQQQVLQGRKEQFKIRENNDISTFQNGFIFLIQTVVYRLRFLFPKLYWILKRN